MKLKSYLEPWLQGSLNGVLSFPASEHKEAYEDGGENFGELLKKKLK